MTTIESVNLTAKQNTVLKLFEIDSQYLKEIATSAIAPRTQLSGRILDRAPNHFEIEFDEAIDDTRIWWIFTPHWKIEGVSPENEGIVTDNKKPRREDIALRLPGLSGVVYLHSPICRESPNFKWYEATHGGTRIPNNSAHTANIIRLATQLQKVRDRLNRPMQITSWYRPEPFNSRAGGAKRSQHLGGAAADLLVSGFSGRDLASQLSDWQGGMGIYPHYPNLLHLDVRGYRARWGL